MFYFAVSLSSINPHQVPFPIPPAETAAFTRASQVGTQLGAGAISFSATVCLLALCSHSFEKMPLSNELHQPWWSKHLSGPLGNNSIKKRGREKVGEVKRLEGGNEWTEKGEKCSEWLSNERRQKRCP